MTLRVAKTPSPTLFCPQTYLERLRRVNASINAFVSVTKEAELEASIHREEGLLKGMTVAVKDNIHVAGHATTCASPMLKNYRPEWDAAVVELLKKEGSIIVGKTNMDEFGMGSHSTRSIFGPVVNPIILDDPNRRLSAGGSSGGSAAAVAAGLVDIGLGSDTGGSVRLPAAFCGIVGFKPSYGRLSRHGLVSYASSLDTVGVMGTSIEAIQRTFNVLRRCGGDRDMTSQQRTRPLQERTTINVGVPLEFISDGPWEVRAALAKILDRLSNLGAKIEFFQLKPLRYTLATYYTLAMAEAASCLARYPLSSSNNPSSSPSSLAFGEHVQTRVRLGRWIASHRQWEHTFGTAMQKRSELKAVLDQIFAERYDLLIAPTSHKKAPPLPDSIVSSDIWSEERWEKVIQSNFSNEHLPLELLDDLLTVPANLAGIPAISVPVDGFGIQLMMNKELDEELLALTKDVINHRPGDNHFSE